MMQRTTRRQKLATAAAADVRGAVAIPGRVTEIDLTVGEYPNQGAAASMQPATIAGPREAA
jgi:hypothetical protein